MSSSTQYGAIQPPVHVDEEDDDIEPDEELKQKLLDKVASFTLPYDADKEYRATELNFLSFARPHMRTFHGSWICFMMAMFVWFSMTPLLPHIQESIGVTTADVWVSNMWSMVGTIVLRIILGPLCDQFGARGILTGFLAACAIPLLFAGLLIQDYSSLLIVRFLIGCIGGTLVPAQYWMTSQQFVREVCGMAMAVGGGWAAVGGGLAQVVMGTLVYPAFERYFGNADTAWRVALIFPALVAMSVAYFFNRYSDDCPLGNYAQVQRAGLMQERSAMDSFRSGILNLNAWFLFLQYVRLSWIPLVVVVCVSQKAVSYTTRSCRLDFLPLLVLN
jgi:NNP family nitrate/nitrite transporter-like MFS transporter